MDSVENPPVDLQALADQLKVLAEPKGLLIVHLFMEGVQCNCELGDTLNIPTNLISHPLRVLREAGWVNVERDPLDARWVYYSTNRDKLTALSQVFGLFFDPERIKRRRPTCGPGNCFVPLDTLTVSSAHRYRRRAVRSQF